MLTAILATAVAAAAFVYGYTQPAWATNLEVRARNLFSKLKG